MLVLVDSFEIISARELETEFLIVSPSITVTVLPTVLKDWTDLPGEITITGVSFDFKLNSDEYILKYCHENQ